MHATNSASSMPQHHEILSTFGGLRLLLHSGSNPNRATCEYVIQTNDKLITLYGGKWTTAMSLVERVTNSVH